MRFRAITGIEREIANRYKSNTVCNANGDLAGGMTFVNKIALLLVACNDPNNKTNDCR